MVVQGTCGCWRTPRGSVYGLTWLKTARGGAVEVRLQSSEPLSSLFMLLFSNHLMDSSSHSHRDRKRSRSPYREGKRGLKRHRSRSPRHHQERKERLPLGSLHLHKHDLDAYRPLFTEYLELQKDLDILTLDDREVQGRWKSFVNKWNRGELAQWYDAETKQKADDRACGIRPPQRSKRNSSDNRLAVTETNNDDDEDGYGPALPALDGARHGPAAPSFQELQHKRELAEEDRGNRIADLRYERKQDRKAQKERLEDLAPRAEPGTRERQLEKKRDTAMSNRAFAEAKDGGAEEVGEGELMGDDGDGMKARKKALERQKNEREIRKEEILRAREVEREERLAEHRKKEEKTMDYLRSLAQQRYGGGN
jgi:hypothetical protein